MAKGQAAIFPFECKNVGIHPGLRSYSGVYAHADTDGDIRILEAASDSDKAKAIVKIHRSPVLLLRLHPQLNAVSFPPLSLQSQLSVTSCCKRPASITANYTSVVEGSGCILSCAVFVWIPLVV